MTKQLNINTISYKEFRKKIHKKWYDNFLHEFLFRPVSNYIVYIIVKYFKFITADWVTITSLFVSLLAWYFMFLWVNNEIYVIYAAFLFLSFHLLDVIDWDVARAKVLFCNWKFTNHGSLFDALMHNYYNVIFIISLWYILSTYFNNIYLLYLWIFSWILMVINEVIMNYISFIDITLEKKHDSNITNFKSLKDGKWTFKTFIIAFIWILWLSILFTFWSILDILFWFHYFKYILFWILNISIILVHINLFFKLLRY